MSHLSSTSFESVDLSWVETERHFELLFGAKGLVSRTSAGTLFLNNIDYLSDTAQKSLIQFIVTGALNASPQPDQFGQLRLACGTSVDLKQQVSSGAFREDLYFEISVAELSLPPLRNRQEDIPLLLNWYCAQLNEQFQSDRHFSSEAVACLQSYHWPGNVRELRNLVERVTILSANEDKGDVSKLVDDILNPSSSTITNNELMEKSFSSPLKEARKHFEKEYLITQLKKNHGNVSKTADFIGMERSALHRKLKELGIKGIN